MGKRNRRIIYFNKKRALFKIAILIISIFAFLPSSYLETNFENYEDSNSKDLALQAVKSTSNKLLDQLLIVSYKIESIDEDEWRTSFFRNNSIYSFWYTLCGNNCISRRCLCKKKLFSR